MPRLFGQRGSPSGPRTGIRTATAVTGTGTATALVVTVITCALTGAVTTDLVVINPVAAMKANLDIGGAARVSAAGVLELRINNPTAGNITFPAMTLQVEIRRYPATT